MVAPDESPRSRQGGLDRRRRLLADSDWHRAVCSVPMPQPLLREGEAARRRGAQALAAVLDTPGRLQLLQGTMRRPVRVKLPPNCRHRLGRATGKDVPPRPFGSDYLVERPAAGHPPSGPRTWALVEEIARADASRGLPARDAGEAAGDHPGWGGAGRRAEGGVLTSNQNPACTTTQRRCPTTGSIHGPAVGGVIAAGAAGRPRSTSRWRPP